MEKQKLAIVSLALGLVAVTLLGPIAGIPAVICGHIAMAKIKKDQVGGKGFALAGIILGYVTIVISFLALLGVWLIWLALV